MLKLNQLKNLIYNPIDSINKAALIISFFSLASKLLGLMRDRILAGTFGAGDTLDMYYAAFRIPDTIFNLLIVGALSASFVPILSAHYYKKDQEGLLRIINNVLNIFTAAVIVSCVFLFFLAPHILKFIVPGWSGEKFDTTVTLTQIMLLAPFFLTLSNIASGVLQSTKRFFAYAVAPIFYNIGIIIGVVIFAKYWGVYGLALGVVLGAVFHFLIQLPVVRSVGYRYSFAFDYKSPDIQRIFRIMVPRTLSLGVGQINLFITTSVASTLVPGSLSVFNFANNIQGIFFGLIGISFAVAAFPTMASYLAAGEEEKFTQTFSRSCREIILLIIPSTAYLIIFKTEIVRLIYSSGKFDLQSAALTEGALVFFALSLIAQSLISIIVRTFWALGDTKTPFYTSLFGLAINAISAVELSRYFGVVGLAIAFSLTNIVNLLALAYFMRRKRVNWDREKILRFSFRLSAVTVISGAIVWLLVDAFPLGEGAVSTAVLALRLGIGTIVATILFLYISKVLGVREVSTLTETLRRRILNKVRPDKGGAV